jgi:hypothetical protein
MLLPEETPFSMAGLVEGGDLGGQRARLGGGELGEELTHEHTDTMPVGAWAMTGMAEVLVDRDWRDEGEFTTRYSDTADKHTANIRHKTRKADIHT